MRVVAVAINWFQLVSIIMLSIQAAKITGEGLNCMDMSFNEAIKLYRDVYKRFEEIEKRPWGVEGAVIELTHR